VLKIEKRTETGATKATGCTEWWQLLLCSAWTFEKVLNENTSRTKSFYTHSLRLFLRLLATTFSKVHAEILKLKLSPLFA